jgi:hypothetical protein
MGSRVAPRSFTPPVPFGKSPNQTVTPAQPIPTIGQDQGTPTPALSGYIQSPANPMQADSGDSTSQIPGQPFPNPLRIRGGGNGSMVSRQRFGASGDNTVPFFGAY